VKYSIRQQLVLLLLVCSMLPAITVSFFSYNTSKAEIRDTVLAHLEYVARNESKLVSQLLEDRINRIKLYIESFPVRMITSANISPLLKKVGNKFGDSYPVALFDRQGRLIGSTDSSFARTIPAAMINRAITGSVSFSEVTEAATGNRVINMAKPVIYGTNVIAAVLVTQFNMERIEQTVSSINLGATGQTFIINRNGYFITNPQGEKNVILKMKIDTPASRQVLTGKTGCGEYRDYRGNIALIAYTPIPDTGWGLIVKQDATEALMAADGLKSQSFITLALFSLLITPLAFYLGDNISRPIMQLSAWAQKLAQGKYENPLKINAANEIGHLAESFSLMNDNIWDYLTELHDQYFRLNESHEQLEKYRFIINSLKFSGVIAIDADKTVSIFNQTAEIMTGISSADVIGKRLGATDGLWENMPFTQTLLRVLSTGEPELLPKNKCIIKDGTEYILRAMIYPILEPMGKVVGAVCLFRDITEQCKMEEDLLRSEKLNLVGELAAGTAHEIRNPMTSIKGFIQLLDIKTPDKSPDKEYFKIILEEIDRANRIISEFLLLSKPQVTQREDININTLLSELGKLIESQALLHDININMQLADSPSVVSIDKEQIKQVCLNIIQNAMQAMPAGGDLFIKAGCNPGTGHVFVTVKDTGCGIPPENLPKLYQPFFTTKADGTGLGLTVSYRIVEDHGGHVKINSSPGKGAEFTVILPASALSAVS